MAISESAITGMVPGYRCRRGRSRLTLAKSAVAYNSGTLNRSREAGVQWMQAFDGAGRGWTNHQDPDKAARTLRTMEDAAAWPISQPRCGRAFGPPGVTAEA
ncbi:hypothetical protein [Streptomyces sp. NPDC048411]|uniref:hypothetical protein n=1 Tax=Streptomyces sp. NPDC048411 TaxID=3157206 RepID=UPI0034521D6C